MIDKYFTHRRTIRQYTSKQVTDEQLAAMFEAASHAPTTGNMQLYSVIVTRSEEQKKALAPTHFNQPTVTGASVVLTFCADFNRFVKWCEASDAKPGYDNFQSFMTAVLDTVILPSNSALSLKCRALVFAIWVRRHTMRLTLPAFSTCPSELCLLQL